MWQIRLHGIRYPQRAAVRFHTQCGRVLSKEEVQATFPELLWNGFFFSRCDNCTALRASRRFHMNYSAAHWYRMWPALLSTKMHQSTTIRRAAARNITWCTTQCLVVTQKQKQETITSFKISLGGCPFLVVTQTKTKRCHTSPIRRYQTSGAQ